MAHYAQLKTRIRELVKRKWDIPAVEAGYKKLLKDGIPEKKLNSVYIISRKQEILERIQRKAEEYEYLSHN